jgi:hypothetical protein
VVVQRVFLTSKEKEMIGIKDEIHYFSDWDVYEVGWENSIFMFNDANIDLKMLQDRGVSSITLPCK